MILNVDNNSNIRNKYHIKIFYESIDSKLFFYRLIRLIQYSLKSKHDILIIKFSIVALYNY